MENDKLRSKLICMQNIQLGDDCATGRVAGAASGVVGAAAEGTAGTAAGTAAEEARNGERTRLALGKKECALFLGDQTGLFNALGLVRYERHRQAVYRRS